MLKFIKCFIQFFTTITTAVLLVVAITMLVISEPPGDMILFQILISSGATALVTAAFFFREYRTRKGYLIASCIHFLLVCAVMIAIGLWCGWVSPNVLSVLSMVLDVVIVYAITWVSAYLAAKNDADDFNRALKERKRR